MLLPSSAPAPVAVPPAVLTSAGPGSPTGGGGGAVRWPTVDGEGGGVGCIRLSAGAVTGEVAELWDTSQLE